MPNDKVPDIGPVNMAAVSREKGLPRGCCFYFLAVSFTVSVERIRATVTLPECLLLPDVSTWI